MYVRPKPAGGVRLRHGGDRSVMACTRRHAARELPVLLLALAAQELPAFVSTARAQVAGAAAALGSLQLAAVSNDDGRFRGARAAADGLDLLDDVKTLDHLAEDDVLVVEPRGLDGAKEELGAVGARAGVGHGEDAWAGVLEGEVLVSELGAVDRLATRAVARGEIAALAHCVSRREGGGGRGGQGGFSAWRVGARTNVTRDSDEGEGGPY